MLMQHKHKEPFLCEAEASFFCCVWWVRHVSQTEKLASLHCLSIYDTKCHFPKANVHQIILFMSCHYFYVSDAGRGLCCDQCVAYIIHASHIMSLSKLIVTLSVID